MPWPRPIQRSLRSSTAGTSTDWGGERRTPIRAPSRTSGSPATTAQDEHSGACQTGRVPADAEWTFVAVAARNGDMKQQARSMLAANGLEDMSDRDIKIDVICARGHGEDSVRVWVRSEPSNPPPDS